MSFATSSIISNSSELNPLIPFPGAVPTEPQPSVDAILVPDTPASVDAEAIDTSHKKGISKDGLVFSYAEEISLCYDNDTFEKLTTIGPTTIGNWAKKIWHSFPKFMSMLAAMRINSKAGKEIVQINSKFVERFPVDKDCHGRLHQVKNLKHISKNLGFTEAYLRQLGTKKSLTISKERADDVNNYFKMKNIGSGSDIFDLEGAIRKAKEEYPELAIGATTPVDTIVADAHRETKKRGGTGTPKVFSYAQKISLLIDDDTQKELSTTDDDKILEAWTGEGWDRIPKIMSMRDAMNINSKAGKEIININSKSVTRIPTDKDCRDRVHQLGNLKNISKALGFPATYLSQLGSEKCQTISKERADKINNYIKKKKIWKGSDIFDLEGSIRKAKEEHRKEKTTKDLSEEYPTRKSKRSSSSDTSTTSEDEDRVEPSPKRRRVTNDKIQTARGQFPPSDDFMEAARNWRIQRMSDQQIEPELPLAPPPSSAQSFVSPFLHE